jgi:hypothetical protein
MNVMSQGQPLDATIVYVWNERMVNLAVIDHGGIMWGIGSVRLMQDGDTLPPGEPYCEWMPYQKGQAAKVDDGVHTLMERVARLEGIVTPLT